MDKKIWREKRLKNWKNKNNWESEFFILAYFESDIIFDKNFCHVFQWN